MKLKKNDPVIITAGKDKGKRGEISRAIPKENKVVVSGLNIVKRHQKPGAGGAGGIVQKEMPIHVSNVAYYDSTAGKASRIRYQFSDDGKKTRIAVASGEQIDS